MPYGRIYRRSYRPRPYYRRRSRWCSLQKGYQKKAFRRYKARGYKQSVACYKAKKVTAASRRKWKWQAVEGGLYAKVPKAGYMAVTLDSGRVSYRRIPRNGMVNNPDNTIVPEPVTDAPDSPRRNDAGPVELQPRMLDFGGLPGPGEERHRRMRLGED